MTLFKGYTRRQEPKWPFVLTGGVLVLAVIVVLLNYNPPKKVTADLTTSVSTSTTSASTLTTLAAPVTSTTLQKKVESAKKIVSAGAGVIERIEITEADGKIYCRLHVNLASVPETIHSVWLDPNGAVFADIPLTVSRQPADTWSYISQYGGKTGTWQVQIKNEAGEILATESFEVAD